MRKTVADTSRGYVLHPSLMDSALQASIGLIEGGPESNQPRLPFALETLRIVSPCTPEMFAWVRYAPGSQAADNVVKLDIDLCADSGRVCVQMHGFSSRALGKEIDQATGSLLATPVWQASVEASTDAHKREFAEHHVILCELSVGAVYDIAGGHRPPLQCLALEAGQHKTIAQRYSEYALACFERIRTILQGKPQGKVLFQVVIADHQEQVLLAGLSGLLKTGALVKPQVIGHLISTTPETIAEKKALNFQKKKNTGPSVRFK